MQEADRKLVYMAGYWYASNFGYRDCTTVKSMLLLLLLQLLRRLHAEVEIFS